MDFFRLLDQILNKEQTLSDGLREPVLSMLLLGRCGGCPKASSPSCVSGSVSRMMEGGENKTDESPIKDLLCKEQRVENN
jgi:hypothetical protein